MAACSACGATMQDGARFCPSCGATPGRQCPSCAAQLAAEALFCPSCGTRVATPVEAASTLANCAQCGAELPAGSIFCPSCGHPVAAAEPAPAATVVSQGTPFAAMPIAAPPVTPVQQPWAQPSSGWPAQPVEPVYAPPPQQVYAAPAPPPAQWGAYAQPAASACLACGAAMRPGARFCRGCGAQAGTAAPAAAAPWAQQPQSPAKAREPVSPRTIAMGVAFALALISPFLDWVSVSGAGIGPFSDGAGFRLADWLTSKPATSPPPKWDGFATLLLAGIGLASVAGSSFATAPGLRSFSRFALGLAGPVLAAFFTLQLQYLLSNELSISDVGIGLWLLGAAAAIATISRFIPAARG